MNILGKLGCAWDSLCLCMTYCCVGEDLSPLDHPYLFLLRTPTLIINPWCTAKVSLAFSGDYGSTSYPRVDMHIWLELCQILGLKTSAWLLDTAIPLSTFKQDKCVVDKCWPKFMRRRPRMSTDKLRPGFQTACNDPGLSIRQKLQGLSEKA